ncbi:MAG: AAA family ATPase, partial [Paludibacteraceae bacterium]|nr:AAA family ATPase [Paludibacteraceae bacterium]
MDLQRIHSDQREELYATEVNSFVARNEEAEIKLESSLAQVVIGVRRSGKSTLCQKKLLESGLNFAYVNFDDDRLYGLKTEQL